MTIRRLWVPLLLATLVAALLGPSVTAAEPRAVTGKIMISAASLIPTSGDLDYTNDGYTLWMGSGFGVFTVPLTFPVQTVKIRKITLYAYDNGPGDACVSYYRASPPTANEIYAGSVCTTDSAVTPQALSTSVISPRQANTAVVSPYLWVTVSGDASVYGVAVLYSYEP